MGKKKNKEGKRMARRRVRRAVLFDIDTDRLGDIFCELVGEVWEEFAPEWNDTPEDGPGDEEVLWAIAEFCKMGWNVAVNCDDPDEGNRFIDEVLAADCPEEESSVLEIIRLAMALTLEIAPDRVPIGNVVIVPGDDGPAIEVKFDLEFCEEYIREEARNLPSMDEILDRDALQKATEGVPPDQVEAALKAEVQRQIDVYNNTPQEALGGRSPNEAYQNKQKS